MDMHEQSQGTCGGCSCGCKGCGSGGHCGSCGGLMHGRHWVHVIIKICVALIIFWCGVQFGELKAMLHGGYGAYGPSMMGGWGARNQVYFTSDGTTGYGMMSGWSRAATSTR